MRQEKIKFDILYLDEASELSAEESELLDKAAESAQNAYAPYSQFRVGAAVRLANGQIIQGNNQENAAYPSGLCAERVALFYASSKYPDIPVEAIAVTAISEKSLIDKPIPPCGACRQVMAETENRWNNKMRVIMRGQTGPIIIVDNMETLLPFRFLDAYLPK